MNHRDDDLLHDETLAGRPAPAAAGRLRLVRHADGRTMASRDGVSAPVRPVRCFPWSRPGAYISLRDDKDREFALVHDPADLDAESRRALELALAEAGFVLHVTRIAAVDEELEIRTWKVETRQGSRTFQTARDEWPRPLPGGGFLVRDVAGDLYVIPHGDELDAGSRRALWAFSD